MLMFTNPSAPGPRSVTAGVSAMAVSSLLGSPINPSLAQVVSCGPNFAEVDTHVDVRDAMKRSTRLSTPDHSMTNSDRYRVVY